MEEGGRETIFAELYPNSLKITTHGLRGGGPLLYPCIYSALLIKVRACALKREAGLRGVGVEDTSGPPGTTATYEFYL